MNYFELFTGHLYVFILAAFVGLSVITRVSPLASWTAKDVWAYAKAHAIPLLPLYDQGFTSIGCEPCTTIFFTSLAPKGCSCCIRRMASSVVWLLPTHE